MDQQQETNLCEDPNRPNMDPSVANVVYPKRPNYARALSPYNHIYMEIDPTEVDPNGNQTLANIKFGLKNYFHFQAPCTNR